MKLLLILLHWNFKLITIWKLLCWPQKRRVLVSVDAGAKDHNHVIRYVICIVPLLPLISYKITNKDCTNLSGWLLWEFIISTFLDGKIARRANRRVHLKTHKRKLATRIPASILDLQHGFGQRNSGFDHCQKSVRSLPSIAKILSTRVDWLNL